MIKALAPWFGAKRTLAPRIVEALGPHRCYWEPFCGSMAVLLNKPTCGMETVNDLNGDLINLARVIRDDFDGPRLYRRLRRTLCVEELQTEARGQLTAETDPFDRAYWYFIESWLGRNGCSGTLSSNNGFCIRFTNNGGSPSVRFESAVQSIPTWRRRMRRVIILRKDAFWLLGRIGDARGTAIYCDPPYLTKGAKYLHDFESAEHQKLADSLRRFANARVVVSYYDHPDLARLYPGWTMIKCPTAKAMGNVGQRQGKQVAPEVLLVNHPSNTTGLFEQGDPPCE